MDYEFVKGQFTEAQLEAAIIEIFRQQDYIYVHGEKIHRQYEEILLEDLGNPEFRAQGATEKQREQLETIVRSLEARGY